MTVERKHKTIRPRFFAVLLLACLIAMGAVVFSQQQKLDEIAEEKALLTTRYEALISEEQRLSYMIEYAKSEEYMLQYAREKLGYIGPDDIKLEIK